ncbi:uncharacterized protein LOC119180793 isoform X3 [Rhipicephalus microplus]|uniref:uncharacterized protein LOC119180793 isoform X3 n=1 Tax=Rhipicephalus microplus TaxID=6941 RepID=UPI003F6DA171
MMPYLRGGVATLMRRTSLRDDVKADGDDPATEEPWDPGTGVLAPPPTTTTTPGDDAADDCSVDGEVTDSVSVTSETVETEARPPKTGRRPLTAGPESPSQRLRGGDPQDRRYHCGRLPREARLLDQPRSRIGVGRGLRDSPVPVGRRRAHPGRHRPAGLVPGRPVLRGRRRATHHGPGRHLGHDQLGALREQPLPTRPAETGAHVTTCRDVMRPRLLLVCGTAFVLITDEL